LALLDPSLRLIGPYYRLLLASILAFTLILGLACGEESTPTPAPTGTPPPTPTSTPTVTIKYATGFKIEYLSEGYKKITDGEGRELLLIPRGKQAPERYKDLQKIEIPVERVVVLSSTEASLLRPLGVLDSIVGVSQEKGWYIQEVKTGLQEGRIKFLGGNNALDFEALLNLRPDVVVLFTRSGNMNEVLAKLDELRIPSAVDNEFLEKHPLGRMEWVKFLAAFYDKEQAAGKFFEDAERRVQEVGKKSAGAQKPRVLSGVSVGGKLYPRGGYEALLIGLAGGDYILKDFAEARSGAITEEEFFARGKEADLFIYTRPPDRPPGTSIKALLEAHPVLADLPVIKEGKVWQIQPWYFESLDKTAEIMEDLEAIFYPELFPGYELKHYLKMPRE